MYDRQDNWVRADRQVQVGGNGAEGQEGGQWGRGAGRGSMGQRGR